MILLHIQLYIINFLSLTPSMITFSTSFFILFPITTQLLTADTSINYVKCRYFSNIRSVFLTVISILFTLNSLFFTTNIYLWLFMSIWHSFSEPVYLLYCLWYQFIICCIPYYNTITTFWHHVSIAQFNAWMSSDQTFLTSLFFLSDIVDRKKVTLWSTTTL